MPYQKRRESTTSAIKKAIAPVGMNFSFFSWGSMCIDLIARQNYLSAFYTLMTSRS